jgi:hypothetical protein
MYQNEGGGLNLLQCYYLLIVSYAKNTVEVVVLTNLDKTQ